MTAAAECELPTSRVGWLGINIRRAAGSTARQACRCFGRPPPPPPRYQRCPGYGQASSDHTGPSMAAAAVTQAAAAGPLGLRPALEPPRRSAAGFAGPCYDAGCCAFLCSTPEERSKRRRRTTHPFLSLPPLLACAVPQPLKPLRRNAPRRLAAGPSRPPPLPLPPPPPAGRQVVSTAWKMKLFLAAMLLSCAVVLYWIGDWISAVLGAFCVILIVFFPMWVIPCRRRSRLCHAGGYGHRPCSCRELGSCLCPCSRSSSALHSCPCSD